MMDSEKLKQIEKLKLIINDSKNIVLLTGAGISVPSGIPDFRSAKGVYTKKMGELSPEDIVSASFFKKHTSSFYSYYKDNLIYKDAKPNLAHYYFARLEIEGKLKAVITQNIDNLHQEAGSINVLELHGSVYRNYCTSCGQFHDIDHVLREKVPLCKSCGAIVKPDVVLFEEPLNNIVLEKAVKAIQKADTLIVVGSSLVVYPAAGLVRYFTGEHLVLINKDKTKLDSAVDLVINEDIIKVIKELLKE